MSCIFYLYQNVETFLHDYQQLLQQPQYSQYSSLGIVGVAYDSIWSIALALDIASKRIAVGNDTGCDHLPGDLVPLELFNYTNERVGCIMKRSVDDVKFVGVTVSVVKQLIHDNYNYYKFVYYRGSSDMLMEV